MSRSLNFYRRHRFPEPMINNVYDDHQGKTAYTVHTPLALNLFNRTTTISKALQQDYMMPCRTETSSSGDLPTLCTLLRLMGGYSRTQKYVLRR